jgi:hypothetical protein
MKKVITITAAMCLLAIGLSAQAQIIIAPTMVNFTGTSPGFNLSITYGVTENAGLYTYTYDIVTDPSEPLSSFTLGGTPDPVYTQSVVITQYGGADPLLSGVTGNSIIFGWDFNSGVTSADVSYTSMYGPRLATFTLNDHGVGWTSPPGIPAPTAVPEASTVLAGAMMVLPLGIGAVRAMRKSRGVK